MSKKHSLIAEMTDRLLEVPVKGAYECLLVYNRERSDHENEPYKTFSVWDKTHFENFLL